MVARPRIYVLVFLAATACAGANRGTPAIRAGSPSPTSAPPVASTPPSVRSTTTARSGAATTTTTLGIQLAKPDHAPGSTLPYRGPCPNPALKEATGDVHPWTSGPTFHGLQHLTTFAVGRRADGSVLRVWAGASNDDPHQGIVITQEESSDFCVSTQIGNEDLEADPTRRGAIQLVSPVLGDTIHYVYLDSGGTPLAGQHSYSLISKTFN